MRVPILAVASVLIVLGVYLTVLLQPSLFYSLSKLEDSELPDTVDGLLQGDNKAYAALTSWPAMPQFRPYVEGTLIVPLGARSAARRQRTILIFDWDPLTGAKGLTFSTFTDQDQLMVARKEAQDEWENLGGKQEILQDKVFLGTRLHVSNQWFLLTEKTCSDPKNYPEEVESTGVGNIMLTTSSDLHELLKILATCPDAWSSMLLAKGFSQWGQADLEQEVMSDMAWPCENLTSFVLSESIRLYDVILGSDIDHLASELQTCRKGVREAERQANGRNN